MSSKRQSTCKRRRVFDMITVDGKMWAAIACQYPTCRKSSTRAPTPSRGVTVDYQRAICRAQCAKLTYLPAPNAAEVWVAVWQALMDAQLSKYTNALLNGLAAYMTNACSRKFV